MASNAKQCPLFTLKWLWLYVKYKFDGRMMTDLVIIVLLFISYSMCLIKTWRFGFSTQVRKKNGVPTSQSYLSATNKIMTVSTLLNFDLYFHLLLMRQQKYSIHKKFKYLDITVHPDFEQMDKQTAEPQY